MILSKLLSENRYVKCTRKGFPDKMRETISTFLDSDTLNKQELVKWEKRLFFARYYYGIGYDEYFLFHFKQLSEKGRRQYVGYFDLMDIYERLDTVGSPDLFNDKFSTYKRFKPYYKRNLVLVKDKNDKGIFISFLKNKSKIIIKAPDLCAGKRIMELSIPNTNSYEMIFNSLQDSIPFIAEELIIQDQELAKYHPQSVNTIRYNTFFFHEKLVKLQAVVRMGRGESVVDNAGAGGIYAPIDIETGIIKDLARSERGEEFLFHPDTGVQIIGSQIPKWEELNTLLERVVRVVPEQIQVGWDFALTDNGWVMVEGNTNPVLQVFESNHGLRQLVDNTLGRALAEKNL